MASSEKKVRGTGVAASAPLAVVSSVDFGLPLMSASSSSATGDSGSISRLAGADDSEAHRVLAILLEFSCGKTLEHGMRAAPGAA